jgi:hypothetical protein
MARYTDAVSNVTPTVGNDLITVLATAAVIFQVIDVLIGGMGTASAAQSVNVQRTTAGTTPTSQTPSPTNPNSPAATVTASTGWSVQPTAGVILLSLPVNANGGVVRWLAAPGEEILTLVSTNISLRQGVGTVAENANIVWDQM